MTDPARARLLSILWLFVLAAPSLAMGFQEDEKTPGGKQASTEAGSEQLSILAQLKGSPRLKIYLHDGKSIEGRLQSLPAGGFSLRKNLREEFKFEHSAIEKMTIVRRPSVRHGAIGTAISFAIGYGVGMLAGPKLDGYDSGMGRRREWGIWFAGAFGGVGGGLSFLFWPQETTLYPARESSKH